jgi:hypothetical protein
VMFATVLGYPFCDCECKGSTIWGECKIKRRIFLVFAAKLRLFRLEHPPFKGCESTKWKFFLGKIVDMDKKALLCKLHR